ncbi:MAG TPA: outer membrane lipoprotein carrier protein LolA [Xanthobacteraceae bacterium]|jgi:outer membrane lipoprotein-sorting protein|nr:outer membrane lipoprotein carrier protein LolA [Xanthobacteraceae bacterium]
MAGMGRGLLVGAALGMVALTSAARAETIPLPTPAPLPKEGTPSSSKPTAAQGGGSGLAAGFKSLFHLDREPEPAAAPPSTATGFNATQRTQVDKVSAYLSSIQQLVGDFVQVGPDGSRVRGEFYIQKPGKVRFDYEPPSRIEIIADGQSVVVRDRKLATQDLYPLSQTPLRYLLSDRIDLLKETNIVGVRADDTFVTITIEETQPLVGTSRLMMMVGAKDFKLKQWTITDPQGYDTTVAVSNLDNSKRPDPSLFKIDYTRYVQ